MPRPPLRTGLSLGAQVRAVWERASLLSPPEIAAGVFRFHTIEQANEARRTATLDQMRRRSSRR